MLFFSFPGVLTAGMHGQPYFASGRGRAEEKYLGLGGAGAKSSGRGKVTVKLGAFSGASAIFTGAGAGRASLTPSYW